MINKIEDMSTTEYWKNTDGINKYNENVKFLSNCDYSKFTVSDINLIAEIVLRLKPENY